MQKLFILIVVSLFHFNAFGTSGGCIATNDATSTSSIAYQHCQQYNGSIPCNADKICSWNPVQYYQNYCTGNSLTLVTDGKPCPDGFESTPFAKEAYPNEKFTCCKQVETVAQCCNPGGQPVPAMSPCPTKGNPNRCCNPAGKPVKPMVAASNQCNQKMKRTIKHK